jgi:hypothetical protein
VRPELDGHDPFGMNTNKDNFCLMTPIVKMQSCLELTLVIQQSFSILRGNYAKIWPFKKIVKCNGGIFNRFPKVLIFRQGQSEGRGQVLWDTRPCTIPTNATITIYITVLVTRGRHFGAR